MIDSAITSEFRRFYMEHSDTEKCWQWLGNINDKGYGTFSVKGKKYLAHRVSYLLANNLDTLNLLVLHKNDCHNRACVNPKHLYAGTHRDNYKDSIETGTDTRGERNGNAILSDSKVAQLRADRRKGMTHAELSEKYGISKTQVSNIVNKKSRK